MLSPLFSVSEQNTAVNELKRQAWEEVARGVNSLGEGELRTAAEVCLCLFISMFKSHFYLLPVLSSLSATKKLLDKELVFCR